VYPGADTIIGGVGRYRVEAGDSLPEVARRFDLGYGEIVQANPLADPYAPEVGTELLLPTQWIVPRAARQEDGIVVNLSEYRLYYAFRYRDSRLLATFPIGVGQEGWQTPLGQFHVIEKLTHPAWYVPASIRKERPELPPVIPAGPDNPLGSHALRLSQPSILIHGTAKPWGVGRAVSHGCIRLYPEDIPRLYDLVPVDTPVFIVREPVKVAALGERVYVSAQPDARSDSEMRALAARLLAEAGLADRVAPARLAAALSERSGVPADVSP
jgi:L,D-transpeptidase ErfK/SrfK